MIPYAQNLLQSMVLSINRGAAETSLAITAASFHKCMQMRARLIDGDKNTKSIEISSHNKIARPDYFGLKRERGL